MHFLGMTLSIIIAAIVVAILLFVYYLANL